MSKLFENELLNAKDEDEDQLMSEDDDEAGNIPQTGYSRKRSMLPKGNPATYF